MEEKPNVLLYIIVTVIIAAMLMSCSTTKKSYDSSIYQKVSDTLIVFKTDTVKITETKHVHDSIYVKDSSYVNVDSLGNKTKEIWHNKYVYVSNDKEYNELKKEYEQLKQKRDSIVRDTTYVYVSKEKTAIAKFCDGIAISLAALFFSLIAYILIKKV